MGVSNVKVIILRTRLEKASPNARNKKAACKDCLLQKLLLLHISKALYRFGKFLDRRIRIAVFNAISDAVLDMPFQHNLPCFIESGFRGIDLRKDVLARNILINHPVDGLNLSDNFRKPAVQVRGIHALFHLSAPIP